MSTLRNHRYHDSFFVASATDRLSEADIVDLACGRVAVVHIRKMLSVDECARIVSQLDDVRFGLYNAERVDPPIARFGPAMNDYMHDKELNDGDYWRDVSAAQTAWASADWARDPVELGCGALASAWPGTVAPATRHGRPLFVGMIREINNGAHIHFDDVMRDFPNGVLDVPVIAQLAFNLYLSVPDAGGETTVWRRRWQPDDERFRKEHSYGFHDQVVQGHQFVCIKPAAGDALIFDPRNFHAVASVAEPRRIAVGIFVGLTARGNLNLWS